MSRIYSLICLQVLLLIVEGEREYLPNENSPSSWLASTSQGSEGENDLSNRQRNLQRLKEILERSREYPATAYDTDYQNAPPKDYYPLFQGYPYQHNQESRNDRQERPLGEIRADVADVSGQDNAVSRAVTQLKHDQQVKKTEYQYSYLKNAQMRGETPRVPVYVEKDDKQNHGYSDVVFVATVAGVSSIAVFAVVGAGFLFYRFQKNSKAAADVEYPAYGVTGPTSKDHVSPNGDKKLAHSAQMYHYQHQKQQMIAVEKANASRHTSASDVDSEEEENEEGDYTVYECPGLAPTGEMEVKNPLFHDDSTPMSPPVIPKDADK